MSKTRQKNEHDGDSQAEIQPGTIFLGIIAELDDQGRPLVQFEGNPEGVPRVALTTQSISRLHVSRQVALLFNNGDLTQPVIMGLIHSPLEEILENFELIAATDPESDAPQADSRSESELALEDVNVDGKRVVIEAQDEVVLKCGEASITLTKAGKILIRGKYLLNRSTGVNRILGGSVQVN